MSRVQTSQNSYRSDTELRSSPSTIEGILWFLGLLSLSFSIYATSVGFDNSLFDFHGFRQTQTAISADSILHGGSLLRYETPVLGPPWPLPFEFPIYQGIVAGAAKLFSCSLEQTGRFVSILFYYLCFFPLASILSRIGLQRTYMIPVLALFAVSPIYIFVSRLFMIESTALLFSLLYTDQIFRLVLSGRRWQYRNIAGAALFGSMSGLVKVTTFAPFFALGTCMIAWAMWSESRSAHLKARALICSALFCIALPLAATWQWVKFSDTLRAENPFGVYLTSKMLGAWTYGTLAQRLRPRAYGHFVLATTDHIGNLLLALIVLIIYVRLCRRWHWIATLCLALYVGTIALFFNLHEVHEYYPYSNAIFLVVATGLLITSILQIPGDRAWIGVVLLVLQTAACCSWYLIRFYPIQIVNAPGRPAATALVENTTRPQNVIVILGLDWSPEFPYQAHRRAIMDANFAVSHGAIEQAIANEGNDNIAALVACDQGRYGPRLSRLLELVGMPHGTDLHADNCDIYERTSRSASYQTIQANSAAPQVTDVR